MTNMNLWRWSCSTEEWTLIVSISVADWSQTSADETEEFQSSESKKKQTNGGERLMEEEEEEKTWGFGFQIKPDSDSGATPQHSYTLVNLWRGNSSGTMHLWEHDMMTSWWCQSEARLNFCQLTIFGTSHRDGRVWAPVKTKTTPAGGDGARQF